MGALAVFAPLGGRIAGSAGARLPAGVGLAMSGIGLIVVALLPDHEGGLALLALGFNGIGLGLATPALVSAATAAVPAPRAGMAAAVNNTARQAGGAIGVALIGAISGIQTALVAAGIILLLGGGIALSLIGERRKTEPARAKAPGRRYPAGTRGSAPPSSA
jgi:DHA2 family methylenomycin A resistance protein-like MFS transporter